MNREKWKGWIAVMGILSLLTALFSGCGKAPDHGPVSSIEAEVTSVPLPEGAELKHLFMTRQRMRAGPYYILKTTEDGVYMKITDRSPENQQMTGGEELPAEDAACLAFGETVKDCERASLVLLRDDGPVRELEKAVAEAGALGWDGFQKQVSMPDVKDSGDLCRLYLELTDGTTVTVDGYNAMPAGFVQLLGRVEEIFRANSDYSRYRVEDFDESACTSLYARFGSADRKSEWRLEMQRPDNRWIVVLTDPKGQLLHAGTDSSDYRQEEGDLPFDRFLEILNRHGAEQWNGYEASDPASGEAFAIRLVFENGKEFFMEGTLPPEGFGAFREDFVNEIHLFYQEYRS